MIIKSPNKLVEDTKKSSTYVFLAGPIQGAPNWQNTLPEINGVTWISPRRDKVNGTLEEDDFSFQVQWEQKGLAISDIVLFWIPNPIEEIPGRDYAQTTRMELLENLALGKKVILGIEEGIHASRYMTFKAREYGIKKVHNTLEDCLSELREYLNNRKDSIFFTSDTHFSSNRTLELSKRPFNNTVDMDFAMISRWNKIVTPGSTVYHLGDFGDYNMLRYLNGNIKLILGNYEKDELEKSLSLVDYLEKLKSYGFSEVIINYDTIDLPEYPSIVMSHKPLDAKKYRIGDNYCLFGHIHGRQKVKEFGIDVGVDSSNFTPMSIEDVSFFFNALKNKYYDDEVFS